MDPYKILGVSENASDEEIKAAYRQLVKKYHPDQYGDNPLADLAQEKLKEVNEAYAEIEKMRSSKSDSYYQQGGSYGQTGRSNAQYAAVRARINEGRLNEAEAMLAQMSNRDAEWYFLMGCIYRRKGWHNEATQSFGQAAKMAPGNAEYARAFNESARRAGYYTNTSQQRGATGCDICTTLCAADCCCECLGGDLIPCC